MSIQKLLTKIFKVTPVFKVTPNNRFHLKLLINRELHTQATNNFFLLLFLLPFAVNKDVQ